MSEPQARIARILQPIRDADALGPAFTTDRGTLAHNPSVMEIVVIPGVVTPEECEQILAVAKSVAMGATAKIPRRDDTRWIYERAAEVFEKANDTFRFRVVGLIEEPLVSLQTPEDKPPWIVDCARNLTANRKLSLTLLLTAPGPKANGTLQFAGREAPHAPAAQGAALVYPSFLGHRPVPLTEGHRVTLLAYAYGPTFE
jgi:PKHD-type hydroxylase